MHNRSMQSTAAMNWRRISRPQCSKIPNLGRSGGFDIANGILHRTDLLDIRVRYRDAKLIFERHDHFHDVEAIATKVIEKAGFRCYLVGVAPPYARSQSRSRVCRCRSSGLPSVTLDINALPCFTLSALNAKNSLEIHRSGRQPAVRKGRPSWAHSSPTGGHTGRPQYLQSG